MNQALRNKIIFFLSFATMISVLVSIAYMAFLRKVPVDVMDGIEIVYSGENGNASVEITKEQGNFNQRAQAFLDTLSFEVSPNTNLANGDVIHIKASFDQEVADQYNFEPINTEKEIRVKGLVDQYDTLEDIDLAYLETIFKESENYVQSREKEIFTIEVDDQAKNPKLVQCKTIYQAFLKSKSRPSDDRMIEIKKLIYEYNEEEYILFLEVIVPHINQSKKVLSQDIYGEKANLTEDEIQNEDYGSYVNRVFRGHFDIQEIVSEEETKKEEPLE